MSGSESPRLSQPVAAMIVAVDALIDSLASPDAVATDTAVLDAIAKAISSVDPGELILGGIPSEADVATWSEPVQYHPIADTEDFTIGIFLMQKGSTIPLHNHPAMSVVSRLLFGELRERCFDWDHAAGTTDTPPAGHVRVVKDEVRSSTSGVGALALIGPESGNLHELYCLRTCAFLDVFVPPYVNGVRDCSYYTVVDGDGVDTPTLDHPMAPTATPTGTVAVLQPYDPAFFTGDWAETISERRRRQSTGDRELQLDHQPT